MEASAPGEGIQHWDANSAFSQTVESKVLAALSAQGVKSKIDGIIWHQGETDWQFNGTSDVDATADERSDPTYYPTKLNALINRYRNESWFDANKPFICGETKQAPVNDRLTALNSDNDPWTACVTGSDLPTKEQDLQATPPKLGTHFNAAGLRELGQRYGTKYLEMTDADTIALPKEPTIKVMAVCDSITEGVLGQKSYRNELVPLLTQSECSFEMVGSKLNNETSTSFRSPHEGYSGHPADRFINGHANSGNPGIGVMMSSQSPDTVLIHLGSNDMRLGQGVSQTVNEIDQIVTRIWNNNPQAEVFVANVIPWFGTSATNGLVETDVQALGTAVEQWINNQNDPQLHLVDVRSQFSPNMMISDLIHPNAVGEAHIADAFYDTLSTVLGCEGQTTIDLIAPETFITVPANGGSANGTTTYSGHATDTGGSGFDRVCVAIRDNNASQWYNFTNGTFGAISQGGVDVGITNANLSNTTNTNTNWSITATLPAGDYTFFALAFDNAGNDAFHGTGLSLWPTNNDYTIQVADTTAPTVVITSPSGTVSSSPVTISGTASDESAIARNRLLIRNTGTGQYWNGSAWVNTWSWFTTNGTNNWSYGIDLQAGNYTTTAWAWDSSNNRGKSATNGFTVGSDDNVIPSITIDPVGTPAPGAVTISGSSSDNKAIDRNRLLIRNIDTGHYWNGSAWTNNWAWFVVTGTNNWSYTLDLPAARYTATAWASDSAGNRGTSSSEQFIVATADNTSPSIQINPVGTPAPGTVTITGTSSDNTAIDRNRLLIRNINTGQYWNGSGWTNSWAWFVVTGTNNWSYTLDLPAARFTATAWASDSAGNRGISSSIQFNVE